MARAKARVLNCYTERHHVIPRCLGGSDSPDNLVNLTPEEHYVAHQLLVRMHPNNPKLIYAAVLMTANRPSNKLYGWLRRRLSEERSRSQSGTLNTQYGTRWIYNEDVKVSIRIDKDHPLPVGWQEGRRQIFDVICAHCGNAFPKQNKQRFCSDTCRRHSLSPSTKLIDNNIDEMIQYFKITHSITATLHHFGITGSRAGNTHLSNRLKSHGFTITKRGKHASKE